jgi:hypothetical protein
MPNTIFAAIPEPGQGEAAHHRDEQHLEDIALGESADKGVGNDVHQERHEPNSGRLLHIGFDDAGIDRRGIDVHADAGLQQVDGNKPDDDRDRRHHFKISQGFDGDSTNTGHVRHMRDAVHDGAEDDRTDQHPDRLDEGIAEWLHLRRQIGIEDPEQDTERHGDQHLHPKLRPPAPRSRTHCRGSIDGCG